MIVIVFMVLHLFSGHELSYKYGEKFMQSFQTAKTSISALGSLKKINLKKRSNITPWCRMTVAIACILTVECGYNVAKNLLVDDVNSLEEKAKKYEIVVGGKICTLSKKAAGLLFE